MELVLKGAIEPSVSRSIEAIYTSREVADCIEVSKSVLVFEIQVSRVRQAYNTRKDEVHLNYPEPYVLSEGQKSPVLKLATVYYRMLGILIRDTLNGARWAHCLFRVMNRSNHKMLTQRHFQHYSSRCLGTRRHED